MSFDVSQFLKGVSGEARRRALAAGEKAVEKYANHVVGKAQRLAPVDTGALKSSGTAEAPTTSGGAVTCLIGFNTDYAAAVHERLDLHHTQGQAKYLERAMQQEGPKLRNFVEKEMRDAL